MCGSEIYNIAQSKIKCLLENDDLLNDLHVTCIQSTRFRIEIEKNIRKKLDQLRQEESEIKKELEKAVFLYTNLDQLA